MLVKLIYILVVCTRGLVTSDQPIPKVLTTFSTSHPGFITLARNTSDVGKPTWNAIISRFNGFPFSTDYVSLMRDIGGLDAQHSHNVEDITSSLHWPNEPGSIPEEVFGRGNMVIIPSGFLVPTKGQGALTIFDLNTEESMSKAYPVTSNSEGDWFYHRAIWLDMDGDGKLDIVTCRAQRPIFGKPQAELLWLKQPDSAMPWNEPWKETVLLQGESDPDTFLIPAETTFSNGQTVQLIITAGFFSQSLDVWYRRYEMSPWTSANLFGRQIDSKQGNTFDLLYEDLNSDGVKELLVTYNKAANGTVYVYEVDGQPTGPFKKQMIMSGLTPAKSGTGKGAPGGIKLAWPDLKNKTGRPDIILSGDDNGKLYLLRAVSSTGWQYQSRVLVDSSPGTMGAMAVGDINNDNYPEIIAPSYDDNTVTILSYNPSTSATPTHHPSADKPWWQRVHSWFTSIFH